MKTKKQLIKEKQKKKKEAKRLREAILKRYIDELEELVNKSYYKMNNLINSFNQRLIDSTVKYGTMKQKFEQIFHSSKDRDITEEEREELNKLLKETIAFEKENVELYNRLAKRDENNEMAVFSQEVVDSVLGMIEKAEKDLNDKENGPYIVSLIRSRSYRMIDEYNAYIVEVANTSSDYIDTYDIARDDFVEFLKENIELTKINEEDKEEIERTTKYRQRLRVEYYQLENFLKYKGFECNRQNSTTHAIWKHRETGVSVPLPNKSRTVPQGTVSKLLRAINSNRNELAEFIHK